MASSQAGSVAAHDLPVLPAPVGVVRAMKSSPSRSGYSGSRGWGRADKALAEPVRVQRLQVCARAGRGVEHFMIFEYLVDGLGGGLVDLRAGQCDDSVVMGQGPSQCGGVNHTRHRQLPRTNWSLAVVACGLPVVVFPG